jgi:hypothetical protein
MSTMYTAVYRIVCSVLSDISTSVVASLISAFGLNLHPHLTHCVHFPWCSRI